MPLIDSRTPLPWTLGFNDGLDARKPDFWYRLMLTLGRPSGVMYAQAYDSGNWNRRRIAGTP